MYQIVQNYFEDWLANYYLKNNERLPTYVENEYRDYFKCGILCHGFARARCNCGADYIIAYSCKRRGVCPLHIGENSEQPKMQSARGPPDECCYKEGDVAVPYEQYDQTISW